MIVFVLSYGSKGYLTEKQIPPYYQLELEGLNNRISNEVSDFSYSDYIQKQVERFMAVWGLKGVTLAVVENERLVYARGFGISDEQFNQVQPGNLFRLASVSKLITAVAVMKLVEDEKLSLDDTVFGPNGIVKDSVFNRVKDKKLYKITVRHLLAHAGGWTQRYGDPAFNSLNIAEKVGDLPPATIRTYYKYVASRYLSFPPGSQVAYSNMGYMFLEDVISTVAGKPYEAYIRENILIPNGIRDMHIGKSFQDERFPNEVSYFEQEGSLPIPEYTGSGRLVTKSNGGNPVELLGAAGGWVSSAVELARFITLIDGQPGVEDILSEKSIREMTDNTYAKGPLGWKTALDNGDWYRTGSMAGTSAMLKRQQNGLTWIFISNSSSWKGSLLPAEINRLMNKVTSRVKHWPERDLFLHYPIDSLPLAFQ
ncbi:serine hydrolase domain-containing protein [Gaoshiqia sediminis]|uniref:Beta-lactamase family protein n=1 Tax=Gaoshiqia sediminis TaxID=2986998 RepID=A0AA42C9G9_9BACT|nr:serine hydrolase domain-containing protein [Gaoshiqia sediminis]MCW0482135.1 beta-lactamase family protein [Gaoshiqia sediminis]